MLPEYKSHIEAAADCCKNIHDLKWKVWGALGTGPGDMSVWAGLQDKNIREKTVEVLKEAKEQDIRLIAIIKEILKGRYEDGEKKLKKVS